MVEQIKQPEKLYCIGRIARDLLSGEHAVNWVMVRPFVGQQRFAGETIG